MSILIYVVSSLISSNSYVVYFLILGGITGCYTAVFPKSDDD